MSDTPIERQRLLNPWQPSTRKFPAIDRFDRAPGAVPASPGKCL